MNTDRNNREEAVWCAFDKIIELYAEVYLQAAEIVDPADIDAYMERHTFGIRSRGRDVRIKALMEGK